MFHSPDARRLHPHERECQTALTLALLLGFRMAAGTARSAALGVWQAARFLGQTASLSCRTTAARSILAAFSTAGRTDRCSRRTAPATARRCRGLGANSDPNHTQSSGTQQRKHRSTIHDYLPKLSLIPAQRNGGGRRTVLSAQIKNDQHSPSKFGGGVGGTWEIPDRESSRVSTRSTFMDSNRTFKSGSQQKSTCPRQQPQQGP